MVFKGGYRFFISLLICFFIELGMLTFFRNGFGPYISPLIFFASSFLIGYIGVRLSFNTKNFIPSGQRSFAFKLFFVITGIALCFISFLLFSKIIARHPVDVRQSDIIPQTQILVNRLLHHEFPYKTISGWGYDLFPTYQPLQWLPFALAELFHSDYRWIAFYFLMLVLLIYIFILYRKGEIQQVIISSLLFMPVILTALYQPSIYEASLENLIVAYYLLLSIAIFLRPVALITAAILCCLLSRYSLLLWIPLFLFILYFSGEKKKMLQIIIFCCIGISLIYVLPFLAKDGGILIKGYNYHTQAALAEWGGQSWQGPGEKPFQLFRGLGFAGAFYDLYGGTIAGKLRAYQIIGFSLIIVTVIILGMLFYSRKKSVNYKVFALSSLKIYLVIFYHFIQIPYDYLFLPLIYVSIPIICISLRLGPALIAGE